MNINDVNIGQELVRTDGGYVVGRRGTVLEIDTDKQRVRVQWKDEPRTWVAAKSLEPVTSPYTIKPMQFDGKGRRISWPKYIKL